MDGDLGLGGRGDLLRGEKTHKSGVWLVRTSARELAGVVCKAVDINRDLHRRYRELSKHSSSAESSALFSFSPNLRSELPTSESVLPSITPFNGANTDFSESVEEYLDDVETATLSWDLTVTPGIMSATNKSKIRLFRQNLERDGDA
ncbi:hypothetical protein HOY82DRAFT_618236 [Tuber indicum]|nr:hypothetical protein HOY82DRAFT_618236 [Tuber indicum]